MVEHRKAELRRFITEEMKSIWVSSYLEEIEEDKDECEKALIQTLGVIISQYCLTGLKIVTVFLAALPEAGEAEDSNFHTFGREVKALWNRTHTTLMSGKIE